MTIVAVAGLKGGVGRSSLSVLLAAGGHARGWTVRLADLDPQGTVARWLGPATAATTSPGSPLVSHLPRPTVEALAALDSPGALVLLDLPPGEAPGAIIGLEAAARVIAVTGPSWVELETLVDLERMVEPDGVVVTRFDGRQVLHRDGLARVEGRYGARLLGVVPRRVELEVAAAQHRPPLLDSPAGVAASAILDRIDHWRR